MNALKMLYGWAAFLTIFLGTVVTVLFAIAFVIGGQPGETIAVFAGKAMT